MAIYTGHLYFALVTLLISLLTPIHEIAYMRKGWWVFGFKENVICKKRNSKYLALLIR